MRLTRGCWLAIAALMPLAPFQHALAQTTLAQEPRVEWEERQNADERLRAYGPDLLGDQIDPHTGTLVFEHTDVSLPGNSALDVSLRRRLSQGFLYGEGVNAEFGDWEYVVPRIVVVSPSAGWTTSRCTGSFDTSLPPIPAANLKTLYNRDYSQGVTMEIPGAGSQQILQSKTGAQWPSGASHVTAQGWYLTCIADIGAANGGGQGFYAFAPNGDRYRFDRYLNYAYTKLGSLAKGKKSGALRTKSVLAATEVVDVNGNWVHYDYDTSGRLYRISANDGRQIDLIYTGTSKLVAQVKANPAGAVRTWTYAYRASAFNLPAWDFGGLLNSQVLASVTQPDGRAWSFSLDGMTAEPGPGECIGDSQTLQLTHPFGVTGVFQLDEKRHRQGLNTMMPQVLQCPDPEPEYGSAPPVWVPALVDTLSVTSKTLSGPGVASSTWSFAYELDNGPSGSSASDPTNWTTTTEPGGTQIKYFHNWQEGSSGNKLAKKEIRQTSGSSPLETTDFTYAVENTVGLTFALTLSGSDRSRVLPSQATITHGTDWYRTNSAYDSSFSSASYSFGFPITVTETSSTTAETRATNTVYAHNKTKWVLGLPSTVTRNGKLFDSFSYDTLGRVTQKSRFGTLVQTLTYNTALGQQGTIATATDSHGHVYTLSNWKRGKPQSVARPDGTTFSRVVDDNGWVVSETDANGAVFGFSYNSMGWLTLADRPAPFADTGVSYSGLGTGIVETRTRGAKTTTISYDGMLRATLVKTEATDGSASAVYEKTAYDIFGRATFASWPSASSLAPDGVTTTYDALSRPLSVAENVPPYATTTTQYLSGGQTRVTDPANAVVTTTARGFGDPSETEVMQVIDAMGATTTMTRDVYGNILTLAQSGTQNGFTASVTRQFWYDGDLRLCRHRAPEFGDEVFLYDSEGLLTQSGRGAAAASGCVATIPAGIAVTHGYDALHRETSVAFPAGTPRIARGYDANGNVTSAARTGGAAWSYAYNGLDAITQEKLVVDARTYQLDYAYTANGDLASRTNGHSGVAFSFDPDAYGRPRAARVGTTSYISGASYHPNGLIAGASYLNGQALSQTLNSRQRPDQLKTAKVGAATAVWLTYAYDARGKVSSVTDTVSAAENRSYTYDPNGRLLTATGWWGSGSYVYDALGNIRTRGEGSAGTSTIAYDASNRVASATVNQVARTYTYDDRGNVTSNGPTGFVYDFANQPVTLTGTGAASFAYDANLKRVKEVRGGKTVYTVYSRVTGGLVYRDEVTDARKTDYVSAGGAGLRLVNGVTPKYVHADAQGTALAATTSSGAILWREHYTPFGKGAKTAGAGSNDNDTGFTGHLEDDASGLVYMQARYYDPLVPRFLSTDPIGYQDQLNLYAYVANDPVNAVDPNGEEGVFLKFEIEGGFIVAGELSVGIFVANEGGPAALGGFDVGLLGGVGGGPGAGASVSASVGAFRGSAADFASPTVELNASVPIAGPVGIAVDAAFGENPPGETNPDGTTTGPQAVTVGLELGASGTPSVNATGTIGLSGINGEGFASSNAQENSSSVDVNGCSEDIKGC